MISIIVAKAKNGVIGKKGEIPWKLADDLKHFAKVTKGHTVIMGRKTYESIVKRLGQALPNRKNIIITSQDDFRAPGGTIVRSVADIVEMFSHSEEEVFIIGGGEIYRQLLLFTCKLYVTEVDIECEGDTFFPPYSNKEWSLISAESHKADHRNSAEFTFLELVRR